MDGKTDIFQSGMQHLPLKLKCIMSIFRSFRKRHFPILLDTFHPIIHGIAQSLSQGSGQNKNLNLFDRRQREGGGRAWSRTIPSLIIAEFTTVPYEIITWLLREDTQLGPVEWPGALLLLLAPNITMMGTKCRLFCLIQSQCRAGAASSTCRMRRRTVTSN